MRSLSPAELNTCVLTACRQQALWKWLCSKQSKGAASFLGQILLGRGLGGQSALQQPGGRGWSVKAKKSWVRPELSGSTLLLRLGLLFIKFRNRNQDVFGGLFSCKVYTEPIQPWFILHHCVLVLQWAVKHQAMLLMVEDGGTKYLMPGSEGLSSVWLHSLVSPGAQWCQFVQLHESPLASSGWSPWHNCSVTFSWGRAKVDEVMQPRPAVVLGITQWCRQLPVLKWSSW